MFIREVDIDNFLKNNNIQNINSTEVKPVEMWENAIATDEKPCLFTFGLDTCIGLVGLADKFAFLSHIDMGQGSIGNMSRQWNIAFQQLPNGKTNVITKGCKEPIALYNAIYRNKDKIKTPIDIILVEGICPVDKENEHRKLLESGLENLEHMCMKNLGIQINRKTISSSSILVDSRDRNVILGKQRKINVNNLIDAEILRMYDEQSHGRKM